MSHGGRVPTTKRLLEFPDHPHQRGLATVSQLSAAGFSRSAIRHALTRRWQQPVPGVVAPHRGSQSAAREHRVGP
ncbi:hypothetical protein SAMN05445756_2057 [Kytococcus aerolatus]|uniref:Uncharacterized protein n=1 Tax=Kytococcus aerolatus TaxID=592308 RepID=A0A212U5W3_9MICO|nr:hypothetical protein SAMN05445756_2057 [Kytococcus aerolatus]